MKGNLFLKLEWKRNSKNKPKILSITFLDTFYICSRKNGGGGDGASALIILFYILLIQLMQKINIKFSLTWLWGNIYSSNMTY